MAIVFEQATETYLLTALANSAAVSVDSPNRARSHLTRGVWHLRNFDGELIAWVSKDRVRLAAR